VSNTAFGAFYPLSALTEKAVGESMKKEPYAAHPTVRPKVSWTPPRPKPLSIKAAEFRAILESLPNTPLTVEDVLEVLSDLQREHLRCQGTAVRGRYRVTRSRATGRYFLTEEP
jgi:hypothetical protein